MKANGQLQQDCNITILRLTRSHNVWLIGFMAGYCQLKVKDIESSPKAGDKQDPKLITNASCMHCYK